MEVSTKSPPAAWPKVLTAANGLRLTLALVAALALAGCGGAAKKAATTHPYEVAPAKRTPSQVAACLNARGFLVTAGAHQVTGSSPAGVNFAVRFFVDAASEHAEEATHHFLTEIISATTAVGIDDSGNPPAKPGGAPRTLAAVDLHTIVVCTLHG